MNEGSGTVFHTGSLTGNNLAATNITWGAVTGFPGTVPTFNGSTSNSVGSNQTATNFTGATAFSACAWINPTVPLGSFFTLISTVDTTISASPGWEMITNSGAGIEVNLFNTVLSGGNGISIRTNTAISNGVTTQICFTYDGSKTAAGVQIYMAGSAAPLTTLEDNLTGSIVNTVPVHVGARNNTTFVMSGAIADVRVWNSQLTSGNISTLFSAGPQ